MLNKLLKYDLKYMIRNMGIFYILAIFFAITTRILFQMEQSVMINIISQISVGCMFAMVANIIINAMMRSWVRFRDSIYKDEAYLTHTLPVTKNAIYDSKFFQALIFFVVSFIVVIISLFITYYTKDNWIALKAYIENITTGLNSSTALIILAFLAVVFVEIFNAIQCGFLGIILGYKQNNNKIAFSVLFGFGAYLISQTIVLASVFVIGLFDSSIMGLFKPDVLLNVDAFKMMVVIAIIIYVIIITLMNLICKKVLNKGVNIE